MIEILAPKSNFNMTSSATVSPEKNHPIISKTTINRDIRKYAFKHRAANIWNNLPDWVTNTPSVKSFEHNLDKFWIDHPLRLDHHASADYWSM